MMPTNKEIAPDQLFIGVDVGRQPTRTVVAIYEQIDLLDSAKPEQVGVGGHRVGMTLRRLIDMKVVALESGEGGGVKILATEQGRKLLSILRAYRNSI